MTDDITNDDVQDWIEENRLLAEARDEAEHDEAAKAYENETEVGFVVLSNWWHQIADATGLAGSKRAVYDTTAFETHTARFRDATGDRARDYIDDPDFVSCPLVIEKTDE